MREVLWSLMAALTGAVGCGVAHDVQLGRAPDSQEMVGSADGRDGGADGGSKSGPGGPGGVVDPNNCGQENFRTGRVVPDMLIVLDRSASMLTATVDRWTPAVTAIKGITRTFDQGLRFGLMIFPGLDSDCGPGELYVKIGAGTAGEIGNVLGTMVPGGGTPTGDSLNAALSALQASSTPGDTAQPPRYVLLLTDGQPTCPAAGGSSTRRPELLAPDKALTLQAIDALRAADVRTFVVGYDAAIDAQFASTLTEFAQHGGTERFYAVEDEFSLFEAFETIADSVIACNFQAENGLGSPRYVRVAIDGETVYLDDPNGWTANGNTITLQGAACAKIQEGTEHSVAITLECVPVI